VKKEQGCCFTFLAALQLPTLARKFSAHADEAQDTLAPLSESSTKSKASSDNNAESGGGVADLSRHSSASTVITPHKTNDKQNPKSITKKPSSLISFGNKKEVYYALKSIHLDRCTTPEYVRELRNEGMFTSTEENM